MSSIESEMIEAFISGLKDGGCSKTETISKVAEKFEVDLGRAKLLVHESLAWRKQKMEHDRFVDTIVEAIEDERKGRRS